MYIPRTASSIPMREDSTKGTQREKESPTESHTGHEPATESHTSHEPATESHTSHEPAIEPHKIHEPPTESLSVQKCRKTIRLIPIDGSSNYCDEEGFIYSSNITKTNKNFYYRCKYINGYKCNARVIVKNKDFETTTLTQNHQHSASQIDLTKTKFDSKMNKICNDRKFVTNREAYMEARENTSDGDLQNLPERKSYASFVQRRKRKFEPRIPYNLEDFESSVNDEKYKQSCFFHFVRAMKKTAKKFGLGKDERFLRPILQACCIALLPNNHIKEGFEC
ncbi:hypothetical protein Bhyg_16432, partial [Pseudolycoriella hygida]